MKTKFALFTRSVATRILGLFSLGAFLFVFEACYGTPEAFGLDVQLRGIVLSASDNQPVEGMKISINGTMYDYTDSEGQYIIYVEQLPSYNICVEDIDGAENGSFKPLNKNVNYNGLNLIEVNMTIEEDGK